MFRFHQDGPQAGHGGLWIEWGEILPGILWKKAHWELCECEVQVPLGGLVEEELGEGRGGLRNGRAHGPEDDIQLRRGCRGEEMGRFLEALVEF
jgi:hypothetical protein